MEPADGEKIVPSVERQWRIEGCRTNASCLQPGAAAVRVRGRMLVCRALALKPCPNMHEAGERRGEARGEERGEFAARDICILY